MQSYQDYDSDLSNLACIGTLQPGRTIGPTSPTFSQFGKKSVESDGVAVVSKAFMVQLK